MLMITCWMNRKKVKKMKRLFLIVKLFYLWLENQLILCDLYIFYYFNFTIIFIIYAFCKDILNIIIGIYR